MTYKSDIELLEAGFASGRLVSPIGGSTNLVDFAKGLARAAGITGVSQTVNSRALAEGIGHSQHLVFIVADGLGADFLGHSKSDDIKFLSRHVSTRLTTVFPSTTATALTTLATGMWPAAHGISGWWSRIGGIGTPAAILPFVSSDGSPLPKAAIKAISGFPTLMSKSKRACLALFPDSISDSVFSRYFAGGEVITSYRSLDDACSKLIAHIKQSNVETYTYLYYPGIDAAAHMYGKSDYRVRERIEQLSDSLRRMAGVIGRKMKIVVTADHGFLDIPVGGRHAIRQKDELLRHLAFLPWGDARVMYMDVKSGSEDRVRTLLRELFGNDFAILQGQEFIKAGLVGRRSHNGSDLSFGNMAVLSLGGDVIEYDFMSAYQHTNKMVSHHSGLTPDEMLVPLIVI